MKIVSLNSVKAGSTASSILDMLRFLAALVVFLFHFYVPLPGYQAVMIFFVLSGYFISVTVLKTVNENRWRWTDYLVKRIIRLWIVLIPCLILTFIWAKFQLNLFGDEQKIANDLDLITLVGNTFFLQGILVKNFGMNGPLWSLSFEFWYYILFPCLVMIFVNPKKRIKLLYGFIFIAISFFVGERIMLYFLVWLIGALIPLIKPFKLNSKLLKYGTLIITILITLISTHYDPGTSYASDLGVGIAFALLVYTVISLYNAESYSFFGIPKHFAGFSYTLYLAHYPIANFIMVWLVSPLWPFAKTTLVIKLMLASFVLLYAWILSLVTEKHTDKVRKGVYSFLFGNNEKRIKNQNTIQKVQ
jgi:peptidoglycan/LPS O-acetylase OafA/YrhL